MADTTEITDTTDIADTTDTTGEGFDLGTLISDDFKQDDGTWDTDGYKAHVDGLAAFKAQADEAKAGLPEGPEGYEFGLPEDFALPEGFNAEALSHVDDNGNKVEFDAASMINADDPDIPALQGILHDLAQGNLSHTDGMKKLAGMVVNRELRGVMEARAEAAKQIEALGPQAKARIDTMTRTLNASLPKEQADAMADAMTSADVLRGLETLMKKAGSTTTPAPQSKNWGELSIDERLMSGD